MGEAGKNMITSKRTILVVDDSEINRGILKEIFSSDYLVIEAADGKEAMEKLLKGRDFIAVVLLDIVMPLMDGYQVLKKMNENGLLEKIPVLMITADTSTDAEKTSYQMGAMDVVSKPFDSYVVKQRVNRAVQIYDSRNNLENRVNEQTKALRQQFLTLQKQERMIHDTNRRIIDTICTIVEFRNLESGNHLKRIRGFVGILGQTTMKLYPEYGLTQQKLDVIMDASSLHDIGKIVISDAVLLKPARLSKEEFKIMKSHTTRGCEIVNMIGDMQDKEYYAYSYDIIRHHHERYDGKGYPDGLKGNQISIAAQLTSIADCYDALITERVYKAAYSCDKAYEMIQNGECGAFSPKMLNCFTADKGQMEELFNEIKAQEAESMDLDDEEDDDV